MEDGVLSVPLFTLFGEAALEFRLAGSGAGAPITDDANLHGIEAIRERLLAVGVLLVAGNGADGSGKNGETLGRRSSSGVPLPGRCGPPGAAPMKCLARGCRRH